MINILWSFGRYRWWWWRWLAEREGRGTLRTVARSVHLCAPISTHLQGAVLGEGGAPDEEEGGHDSEEHEGRQVELDEEGVAVVRLQATLGFRLTSLMLLLVVAVVVVVEWADRRFDYHQELAAQSHRG